ncbi:MAG: type II toxin-antitoxin system VapC family toxin [Bacteroidota bacterium]
MNILLDTHALIWFINGDKQLPDKAINLIKDLKISCFVSIASIWEIAIKLSLGKLELNGGFDDISKIMNQYEIELLPITFEHIQKLLTLDYHHRDPFDRIIISQGMVEKLVIISKDENFPKYYSKVIWDK